MQIKSLYLIPIVMMITCKTKSVPILILRQLVEVVIKELKRNIKSSVFIAINIMVDQKYFDNVSGLKRIIVGLLIMFVGLYPWYDTLNENIPKPDSEPVIDADQIIDSTTLMGIQVAVIARGVGIFGFRVNASRK